MIKHFSQKPECKNGYPTNILFRFVHVGRGCLEKAKFSPPKNRKERFCQDPARLLFNQT